MRLVNLDLVMYVLTQTMKDLRKDGREDLAKMTEVIAHHLQDNLDEVQVERCPFCRGLFKAAREEEFYDEEA